MVCVYKLPPTRYSDLVSQSKIERSIEGLLSLSQDRAGGRNAILLLKMLLFMEGAK
jgi:hypothetical protein